MNRRMALSGVVVAALLAACATPKAPPVVFDQVTSATEAAYEPYLSVGNGTLSGQAFLVQQGGGTVRAAGRVVTLDPATATGADWWRKAGRLWNHRNEQPPSAAFTKARRSTVADADGKFRFEGLPAGNYFVRTELTWNVPYHGIQGGVLGAPVTVSSGATENVILNALAK